MGISSRRAVTGVATALLLCFMTAGPAVAEDAPSDGATPDGAAADSTAISAEQTTDVNDRQGWEDVDDQPLGERTPTMCDRPETWYTFTSKRNYHVPSWWNGTKYKDGPGGTMSVSVTRSGTISLEVSGSGEWSAGAILAKAKTTISVKVAGSVSVATGHSYSHDISRNKYGHLQYGSWGYKTTWKKWRSSGGSSCNTVEIGHGTATFPTSETGWKYWETSS
ncbi:hypothetical protein ACFY0B_37245 [Streptomyces sp. NPDC001797]|uniref:hypothetical protein n=1 Tax=Streptomyces sp. NPDC001797 TaxID=3364610 RepID=UPI0036C5E956